MFYDNATGIFLLTLKTARIILVTFSLTESLKISANMGITLNLFSKRNKIRL